jgi:orotate phosphoribosyltransferase
MAIVDDVMSAGSSLRATMDDMTAHGATIVVAGALFVLGSKGAEFFAQHGLPVESVGQSAFDMWPAEACPLCAAGSTVEDVG